MNTRQLVQGNEATALGAFYAGARFFAGYPITPSSEIAELCARDLPGLGGVYMQMEDEIASMGAIIGASLAGAKAFTATSGPGFSLMQENLGVAIIGEVPVVVVNVQRVGPSTGLATKPAQAALMQMRWGRHGDQIVVTLMPATVQECFELMVEAFNIAETYRIPVIFAPDEITAHLRETFVEPKPGSLPVRFRPKPSVPPDQYEPFGFDRCEVAPLASYGDGYRFHISSSMHDRHGNTCGSPDNAAARVAQLHSKIEEHLDDIIKTKAFDTEGCDTLIVACGAVTRAARAAAQRAEGRRVGVLQLQTIWPFPEQALLEAARTAERILVPEMNYAGQLAGEVYKLFGPEKPVIRVNRYNGSVITPADILRALD